MELRSRTFRGKGEGPSLLITSGVHGDEYVPVMAVRELIAILERQGIGCGSVSLIPVVNESAFGLGRRCGEDGLDLARTCPGNVDGLITERTARALSDLIEQVDAYVDLHSGGTELIVDPLAGYMLHADADVLSRQREMARAFNLPLVWGTSGEFDGRSLSVARDANVPAIYVEYLGGVEVCPTGVEACVKGCLNVMGLMGFIERPHSGPNVVEVIEDARPGAGHMQVCNPSPLTGLFEPLVRIGQDVKVGEVLGRVMDPVDGKTEEVATEQTGRVVVLRGVPRVTKGESVGVGAERRHRP